MNKEEDFSKVIKVVTELMDVTEQDILGKSRIQEVVDARWMTFHLLKEKGFTTQEIAGVMNQPVRTVNHAIHSFSERVRYSSNGLGNIFSAAKQQLL